MSNACKHDCDPFTCGRCILDGEPDTLTRSGLDEHDLGNIAALALNGRAHHLDTLRLIYEVRRLRARLAVLEGIP